jgi:hypothetical protein
MCGGLLRFDYFDRSLITARTADARDARTKKTSQSRRNSRMPSSTPPTGPDSNTHDVAKETLAEETHTSVDEVAKLYDEEFSTLAAEAKITQYLGVLVSRRVRLKLRKH